MWKYIGTTGLATLLVFLAVTVRAGTVEIDWQDPEKFRDIRAGNEARGDFQERVTTALGSFFQEAATAHLPADQTLHLTITDVDLAGDVEYFFLDFVQGIRVMRDVYFPSISFTYELRDDSGTIIKSGEENIKDMGYLYSGRLYINDPPFNYEKKMIDDWFDKNFK